MILKERNNEIKAGYNGWKLNAGKEKEKEK